MTIASRELFELCRQVYEATGWTMDKAPMFHNVAGGLAVISWEDYYSGKYTSVPPYPIPLYTSDYLLEKLPKVLWLNSTTSAKLFMDATGHFGGFMFYYALTGGVIKCLGEADTPLKALLKLTLELHREKML